MIYKVWINILPLIRGLFTIFTWRVIGRNVTIGPKIRRGCHTSLRFYNSATVKISKNVKMCDGVEIAVLEKAKLRIGENVGIGRNNSIICREAITIGDGTILGPNVLIFDHNHLFSMNDGVDQRQYTTSPIIIGAKTWIGANVVILQGVQIGCNVTIGAGSVVAKNIPDNCIAVGNPCRVIKSIE